VVVTTASPGVTEAAEAEVEEAAPPARRPTSHGLPLIRSVVGGSFSYPVQRSRTPLLVLGPRRQVVIAIASTRATLAGSPGRTHGVTGRTEVKSTPSPTPLLLLVVVMVLVVHPPAGSARIEDRGSLDPLVEKAPQPPKGHPLPVELVRIPLRKDPWLIPPTHRRGTRTGVRSLPLMRLTALKLLWDVPVVVTAN
jgi:hypothetical protein